ncbi:hypothetical protein BY998_10859 [Methylobacterium sp. B4]|nr:hypothetical protein BY998_10859 [Methylobacterium sp. B4]
MGRDRAGANSRAVGQGLQREAEMGKDIPDRTAGNDGDEDLE